MKKGNSWLKEARLKACYHTGMNYNCSSSPKRTKPFFEARLVDR